MALAIWLQELIQIILRFKRGKQSQEMNLDNIGTKDFVFIKNNNKRVDSKLNNNKII